MTINRNWVRDVFRSDVVVSLLVFVVSLVFYVITAAPTVLWGDEAAYQRTYYLMKIGFKVTSHPLWILLAQPFKYLPFGDIAFRANLVSATFGALTLCLVYFITRYYSLHITSRITATAILGISHTFWQSCVGAEVYTLNAFFFVATWYCLLKWRESKKWKWLIVSCLVFLLSLGNHLQMVVALPGYAYLAMMNHGHRHPYRRFAVICGIPIITAAILILYQPFIREVVLSSLKETANYLWPPRFNIHTLIIGTIMLFYNFIFSLLLAIMGIASTWRNSRVDAILILLFIIANSIVALGFDVDADYVYYMPAYIALAVVCAPGLDYFSNIFKKANFVYILPIMIIAPIAIYRTTPLILNHMDVKIISARDLPGRDAKTYFLWPSKMGYRGGREYGEGALRTVTANSLILADGTVCKTLWYLQQIEGMRSDVLVVLTEPYSGDDVQYVVEKKRFKEYTDWRLIGSQVQFLIDQSLYRPVYLADIQRYYDMKNIKKYFDVIPVGPIYELRLKLKATRDS